MEIVLINLALGVSFGMVLFLLGTGLSLTMGLMKIVNLAHGALYMVGAYVGLKVAQFTDNFVLGLVAGGAATALIGIIIERGFLKPLYKQMLDQILLTIGFVYILTNLTQWIFGALPQPAYVPATLSGFVPIGDMHLPVFRLVIIIFGLAAAVGLWFFQEKTRVGAIIRAGMDNKDMAMGIGLNLPVMFTAVFAMGSFIAGFCGLWGGPSMGINLEVGWEALNLGMIVVIVGGSGSIQGALVGGLIIGLFDSFGKVFFPDLAYFTMYLVLIVILLLRPNGLLGRTVE